MDSGQIMRHRLIVLAVHHDHPTEGPFDARKKPCKQSCEWKSWHIANAREKAKQSQTSFRICSECRGLQMAGYKSMDIVLCSAIIHATRVQHGQTDTPKWTNLFIYATDILISVKGETISYLSICIIELFQGLNWWED